MKKRTGFVGLAQMVVILSLIAPALAGDLFLNQPLATGYYLSEDGIVAEGNCGVSADNQVWFLAAKSIRMANGFHVTSGAILNALIGTHERVPKNLDLDGDNLADWWELAHFKALSEDSLQDSDGDGLTNMVEYRLGSDPSVAASRASGIVYEYDELGRIKGVIRIPSE